MYPVLSAPWLPGPPEAHREGCLLPQMIEVQKLIANNNNNNKKLELRRKVENQRWKLASEFKHLKGVSSMWTKTVLSRLAEEGKDIQQQLHANTEAFSVHISTLYGLQRRWQRSVWCQT